MICRNRITLVALLLTFSVSGCSSLAYYTQAARGHLDLMSRRVPLDSMLASEQVPETLKAKLRVANEARDFAVTALALPDNNSYRSYSDLERTYVLWNVFAAQPFSLDAKQWCYWFVGCLGYRGYFSEAKAQATATQLRADGYDVFVGGVAAYSTLGRFADPLLNTMLNRQALYIPEIMFHELTHQRVYRNGDSEFSESLASFVQQEGVLRWLEARNDEAGMAEYRLALTRERDFVALISAARTTLLALYSQALAPDAMRERKVAAFATLQQDYTQLKNERWAGYSGYDTWFNRPLNNAHLVTIATYHRLIPAFRMVLDETAGDLEQFFKRCAELAQLTDAQLQTELERLLQSARDTGGEQAVLRAPRVLPRQP